MALPRWKKILFAAITVAGFFLLIEAVLWLVGVSPVPPRADPYLAISGDRPVYVESRAAGQMATADYKLPWFNAQSFPKRKPANTYRIFSLGGSTTYGRPYTDAISFSGWLREFLPVADPSRHWEVINAGGISYASYRMVPLMEELLAYQPDLFLIYTGHNEFLERRSYGRLIEAPQLVTKLGGWASRTRLWAALARPLGAGDRPSGVGDRAVLPAEVDTILDHSVGPRDYRRDDAGSERVYEHFEQSLNRMISMAHDAGAEVVLVTPVSNGKDCSPFKSEPRPGLSPAETERFEALLSEAATALDREDFEQAVYHLVQARDIDNRYAGLHYRLGLALDRLGRYADAAAAFQRAVDEDVCPLRATSRITAIVEQTAARRSVPLVDFASTLRDRSPHGIPGADHFLDHVHLNAEGYGLLALEILNSLARYGIVRIGDSWTEDSGAAAARRVMARLDQQAYGESLRNLAKVLGWAGKTEEAERLAHEASATLGPDAETFAVLGQSAAAGGDRPAAIRYFQQAVALRPEHDQAQFQLGTMLNLEGRHREALEHFEHALSLRPEGDADLFNNRGLALLALGDEAAAIGSFRNALRLDPNSANAHHNLGATLLAQGRPAEAVAPIRRAIALDPTIAGAHSNLGVALVMLGKVQEAVPNYREAIRLQPGTADPYNGLGSALIRLDRPKEALASLREAAQLEPDWAPPLQQIAWLLATSSDDHLRDGAEAVRFAERAVSLTQSRDPGALDTLAAAYAEAGRFDDAVTTIGRALAMSASAAMQSRRELYQKHLPYRSGID